jgi:hypothetical protein
VKKGEAEPAAQAPVDLTAEAAELEQELTTHSQPVSGLVSKTAVQKLAKLQGPKGMAALQVAMVADQNRNEKTTQDRFIGYVHKFPLSAWNSEQQGNIRPIEPKNISAVTEHLNNYGWDPTFSKMIFFLKDEWKDRYDRMYTCFSSFDAIGDEKGLLTADAKQQLLKQINTNDNDIQGAFDCGAGLHR